MAGGAICPVRRGNAVGFALQSDCRDRDRRLAGELTLDCVEGRLARRDAVTVTIGLDHHLDESGIVERRCGLFVSRIVKAVIGRPELPKQAANTAPSASK